MELEPLDQLTPKLTGGENKKKNQNYFFNRMTKLFSKSKLF
jgi:hypothetical protein